MGGARTVREARSAMTRAVTFWMGESRRHTDLWLRDYAALRMERAGELLELLEAIPPERPWGGRAVLLDCVTCGVELRVHAGRAFDARAAGRSTPERCSACAPVAPPPDAADRWGPAELEASVAWWAAEVARLEALLLRDDPRSPAAAIALMDGDTARWTAGLARADEILARTAEIASLDPAPILARARAATGADTMLSPGFSPAGWKPEYGEEWDVDPNAAPPPQAVHSDPEEPAAAASGAASDAPAPAPDVVDDPEPKNSPPPIDF